MEAISNRAEMLLNSLLALSVQYGWQLVVMAVDFHSSKEALKNG